MDDYTSLECKFCGGQVHVPKQVIHRHFTQRGTTMVFTTGGLREPLECDYCHQQYVPKLEEARPIGGTPTNIMMQTTQVGGVGNTQYAVNVTNSQGVVLGNHAKVTITSGQEETTVETGDGDDDWGDEAGGAPTIPHGSRFCPYDGASLKGANFCPKCGGRIL